MKLHQLSYHRITFRVAECCKLLLNACPIFFKLGESFSIVCSPLRTKFSWRKVKVCFTCLYLLVNHNKLHINGGCFLLLCCLFFFLKPLILLEGFGVL